MSNELVEASFTSKMKGGRIKVPEKIKDITIKRGKYVMILFFISNLML